MHHYLKPGEICFSAQPAIVTTLLGSCVAVTLFSQRLKVGAICHGLLPSCKKGRKCDGYCSDGYKYVDCAVAKMLENFKKLGVAHHEIEVKVFGGSDMFEMGEKPKKSTIGVQNAEKALEIITGHSLKLVASDLGGLRGRKIRFYTHTGEVLLKRLRNTNGIL